MTSTVKILIAVICLLVVSQMYVLFKVTHLENTHPVAILPSGASSSAAYTQTHRAVPDNTLIPVSGVVKRVSGQSITIADDSQVAVRGDTIMMSEGDLKDAATQDREMEAFRQTSAELAQDPEKNTAALQHLLAPSPYVERRISVSDISSGMHITAFVERESRSGVYTAFKVMVMQAPGASTR